MDLSLNWAAALAGIALPVFDADPVFICYFGIQKA